MTSGDRPLRVLVMDHTGTLAGGEIALLRLCAALDRERVQVRVVLFSDGELRARLEALGVGVDVVPLGEVATADRGSTSRLDLANLRRVALVVPFLVRLARLVRRLRPDVVHTTTLKADVLGSVVARGLRVPLVWYVHDRIAPDYLPPRVVRVLRAAARHVPTRVIANSRATAQTLPGVDCVVAYPGLPAASFVARARVADRPVGRPPVVGLVGRISPTKGQLELVRAARRVREVRPDVRFRIVGTVMFGEDAYAEQVRAESEILGVADAVTWTGFATDPLAAMDELDVCVHASPVPEPFGQVIVEAMARGVPVVATRAGGAPEIVEPDDGTPCGLLVPPGDDAALAAAILAQLADPAAARARALRAHESAARRFDVVTTARTVTDVWLSARRRPARAAPPSSSPATSG